MPARPEPTAEVGGWIRFEANFRCCKWLAVLACVLAQLALSTITVSTVLWLDAHHGLLLLFGRRRWELSGLQRNDFYWAPVWCIAGWMVTQCLPGFNKYNRKAVAFQFGIVVQLPFLTILRALLGYNWFFDPARMKIQPGLFPIFVTIYTVCMVNHVRQYLPEVEQAVEEALGVKKDVAKKVVRRARSPVSIRAGWALFSLSSRGRGPRESPTAAAAHEPRKRAPTGLAALYAAAYTGKPNPDSAASEILKSDAGKLSAPPSTNPSTPSSTHTSSHFTAGMTGITVGGTTGRSPWLSSHPILPRSPSSSTGTSHAPSFSPKPPPRTASASAAGSTATTVTSPRHPSPTKPPTRTASTPVTGPARHASMSESTTPAVRAPVLPKRQLSATKPGHMGNSKPRDGTNAQDPIAVNVSAGATPHAPRILIKQSSSIKEKYAHMKVHLADISNKIKVKSLRSRRSLSPTSAQGSEVDGNLPASTLQRGNSWKIAAKAVKGGFIRKRTDKAVAT